VDKAISDAGLTNVSEVDAIAVTRGPGLEICLRVGCRKAQALAQEFNKPFVTVHHLEAHCLIARLAGVEIKRSQPEDKSSSLIGIEFSPRVEFPFLVFLASGGHTSLMLCHGVGDFKLLGGTLDDALGSPSRIFDELQLND
jgi:N6-L-threonylcarbamoyladenine synthase